MTSKEALNWFLHETRDNYYFNRAKEQKKCDENYDVIRYDLEVLKELKHPHSEYYEVIDGVNYVLVVVAWWNDMLDELCYGHTLYKVLDDEKYKEIYHCGTASFKETSIKKLVDMMKEIKNLDFKQFKEA